MKILANDGISGEGKAALEANGHHVDTSKIPQAELIAYLNENQIEVLLVRSATKVRKDIIDACPSLKMIGRGGVGIDNIDAAYAKEKGIKVFNTPASSSLAVAELVMAHMFTMVRSLHDSNRKMPVEGLEKFNELKKKYGSGSELRGKTIGIIGFGRIGQFTAKYALGCGMRVLAVDPFVPSANLDIDIADQTFTINVNTVSMEEVLTKSDFISVHVPKQADGRAVITANEIAKMKDGVMLINLSRGGVINEDDLITALNSGKVAAAALDVFENEPTPRKDLLTHPKLSLTPHTGAATSEAQDRIGLEIAQIIGKA